MTQKIGAIDAIDAPIHVLSDEVRICVATLIKKPVIFVDNYCVFTAAPPTGILYVINNFISGPK